ncbi:MAG: enoyl-CoA hydratase/isomerase family protein [Chloroflexi bacterium]|nr:enoyl-CoA hydratase/isomerase family protein [Chloroflexota bacterium]
MAYQYLVEEHEGRVAILTLNRPEKLNALSQGLMEEFTQAIHSMKDDPETRVIIVKGAGRAFSAGYDLSPAERRGRAHDSVYDDWARLRATMERWMEVWDYPKPIIAQVHGYCLAGASQLAIMCDLTFVAEDARIGVPSIPIGGGFISPMWCWLVGPKRAKEMTFMSGRQISGKEAELWGWANRAFPADRLEQEVRAIAHRIAKVHPDVLRMKKLAVNRVMDMQGFRQAVFFGCEWDTILHFAPPVQELTKMNRELGPRETIQWWEEHA